MRRTRWGDPDFGELTLRKLEDIDGPYLGPLLVIGSHMAYTSTCCGIVHDILIECVGQYVVSSHQN